ncbi:class I SAM-dependent methyltransferase [Paenibacillus sp. BR1-192]|uniref:class I SAM-dependent methyltransferase n=1 Tax=Paenibacillus sp. BR1-192 TaxID=3032287 RepID=UPI00240E2C49|nr:class I SAM-dependent methyltransferase [Paenibacillus sp. BR1-192]WFB58116.1 class I SAM-dependent methyltransferase [Paenibacillus sp. BR1-192]
MEKWKVSTPIFESDSYNEKLRVAPWEGHRGFAYDYVRFAKPRTIVELGTHYGCSFFSFCQAIKDLSMESSIAAIDTWTGDIQAGYYQEEVFETVKKTIELFYKNLNIQLKRKTFDEALREFEDNSIDLLHIDGLHTYEAVKHDFETWLPKISNNGVVFFHDVYSPLEYGSNRYWEELRGNFLFLEFKHSWGLGILFPKGTDTYNKLMEENIEDKILYYTSRALYELEQIKNKDLTKMVEERDKVISVNELMIQQRDKTIESNEAMIRERDKTIESNEAMIRERDKTIESNEAMIRERDKTIESNEAMIRERDKTIESNEAMIRERDKVIKEMGVLIEEQNTVSEKLRNEILELNSTIIDQEEKLKEFTEKINCYQNKKIIINFRRKM